MPTEEEIRLILNVAGFIRNADRAKKKAKEVNDSFLEGVSKVNEKVSKFGQILTGFGLITVLQQAAGLIGQISDQVDAFNRRVADRALRAGGGGRPGSRSAAELSRARQLEEEAGGRGLFADIKRLFGRGFFEAVAEQADIVGLVLPEFEALAASLRRENEAIDEAREARLAEAKEIRGRLPSIAAGERQVRGVLGPRAVQGLQEAGATTSETQKLIDAMNTFSRAVEVDRATRAIAMEVMKRLSSGSGGPEFSILPVGQ